MYQSMTFCWGFKNQKVKTYPKAYRVFGSAPKIEKQKNPTQNTDFFFADPNTDYVATTVLGAGFNPSEKNNSQIGSFPEIGMII